ncbi:MAG: superoxide dismutase [Candidatus Magasanikbacteria bacterium RIFCSPHIGHO2_02_FULL_47_14]|uniref:superoxide dismutase n=1 Tax=Candidatus Magasanikbacteria bacterium RIFCSPHIGHO2_02_FULL_47_14 TaxID=1798680 RepID=A0A1F6M4C5_9BACT|nr:MAG: superoxide dismutase [Candidatus Magasanikbacteria bacterium RIFCSPHIGHO2_02_FULL_47_14]
MSYEPKDFSRLLGTPGFSDQLLNNHFTLYQGYVKNTNILLEKLDVLLKSDQTATPEYAELSRRLGWEFNGMRLHEYYFENMSREGGKLSDSNGLTKRIVEEFGSYELWEKDFKAVGAMRGIGWVVMYDDPQGCLFNMWVNEHDVGHLAGCTPLLVMDVFEHAFMIDYGLKRADYISAFFNALDWSVVQKRFETRR